MRRGDEYSIMAGGIELMGTRMSGSEEALADLTAERVKARSDPKVLIGGLGMGFTLRAALRALGPRAQVTVAELVPAVVAWARGPLAHVFAGSLDDRRVSVREGDIGPLIGASEKAWDAILLDVDNGPEGLTRRENDSLYDWKGLAAAKRALKPGGVLSVWSSAQHPEFTRRLKDSGFEVEEARPRANKGKRGGRHVIWLATRPV